MAERAAVPQVVASQLRDGVHTAAIAATVGEQICRLLVGHHSGSAGHYVLRQPAMVRPATNAVRAAYIDWGHTAGPSRCPVSVPAAEHGTGCRRRGNSSEAAPPTRP